ncbi:ribosome maturation factor RimM [Pseudarthrobacter sp. P1]|uniref:ribosome maturation factor RimM n=1 Tax=Pseudarthrobacter sp. P1 TaxID=3418418 RepID=UPI003CF2038E
MQVQIARIGKPHGIRGEVTVQVLTDAPEDRFVPGVELVVKPATLGPLTVRSARWNKDILLLGFERFSTRNEAETLRGATLFVESDDVEDDGDDAWYEHELVGLAARVGTEVVGKVAALRTMPVQDLLIIENADGEEILVPFVEEIVPEVNIEGGYILLTPPPGLFDINNDDAAGPGEAAAEAGNADGGDA